MTLSYLDTVPDIEEEYQDYCEYQATLSVNDRLTAQSLWESDIPLDDIKEKMQVVFHRQAFSY